ncbi:hypothetical protein Micbo1qcDRAFT_157627 [Microdochium bolleyi]|uniref:Uncharacterized protein n=1 Tax=Microdochium bolleyi TaxID=196109 RepID=A0A136JEP7_9PEZI|nr:hypothetical protein Micbo1qcDRAFT_157627 [Microdochium bolleyi]
MLSVMAACQPFETRWARSSVCTSSTWERTSIRSSGIAKTAAAAAAAWGERTFAAAAQRTVLLQIGMSCLWLCVLLSWVAEVTAVAYFSC